MSNEDGGNRDEAPTTLRSFSSSNLPKPPASQPGVIEEVEELYFSSKPSGSNKIPGSGRGYLPTNEPSASNINLPKRPLPLGKCVYVHFGGDKTGHFCSSKRLLRDSYFGDFINPYDLDSVVDTLSNHILASAGADYANTFIGGDVGERRKVKINGQIKEVLVIPQGKMRAEANSANFAGCNMEHPLADPEKMLEVMALTMFLSGFPSPYLRVKGFGDLRNDMALRDPILKSSFVAVTWEFSKEPSYKLPAADKKAIVSPSAIHEHRLYRYKIVSVYQTRLWDRQQLWKDERALQYVGGTEAVREGKADVTYCQGNGMIAESSCQNNRLYVPLSNGLTLVGSPVGSFFRGKTDMTSHRILHEIKPEGITAVEFHTPEEFARTCGYINQNQQLTGRELTYAVLRSKCDGMVFAGTFKGIAEKCSGILPEEGEPITFKWDERTIRTYETEKKLLWNTIYGLNGGTKLTQDPYYCCMFDVNDLQNGIAKHLDLREATLEDIV